MIALCDHATRHGWRTTLEEIVAAQRPNVVKLITDESRGNFQPLIPLEHIKRALDFGCGFGGISFQLADNIEEVYAIDAYIDRLKFLNIIREQEGIHNIFPLCNSNVLNLPFSNKFFDLISLVGVFEYLPMSIHEKTIHGAQQDCLGEIARVLSPGGYLYLATKNRFGWQYLTGSRDHNGVPFGPVLPRPLADLICRQRKSQPYRIIVDSLRGYRRLLSDAGFDDIKIYWPIPGYQHPDHFLLLDHQFTKNFRELFRNSGRRHKQLAMRFLATCGVLRYIVPNFSIVARRAASP